MIGIAALAGRPLAARDGSSPRSPDDPRGFRNRFRRGVAARAGIENGTSPMTWNEITELVERARAGDRDGVLRRVIVEVHNTYGQRHVYLLPPANRPVLVTKKFYVSPFNPVAGHYQVLAPRPDQQVDVVVSLHDDGQPAFVATLRGFDEHPQTLLHGDARLEDVLGSADYSLVANGRHDLFTFCMCAGGYIMPSVSEQGAFCTNGMSLSRHDSPYANSGLVVTVPTEAFGDADVLAGMRLQQYYERLAFAAGRGDYLCPVQRATDFLADRPTEGVPPNSYPRGAVAGRIAELVPPVIVQALEQGLPIMDRRWRGAFLREATLVGPEARGSAPVRIVRDETTRETPGICVRISAWMRSKSRVSRKAMRRR